jgi:hypothetical protein
MIAYSPRLARPPRGARLDRTSPLARGLMSFYALNEGAGGLIADATGRIPLRAYGTTWVPGGLSCVGTNAGTSATIPPSMQVPWPVTAAIGLRQLAVPTANETLVGATYNNANTSPYWAWAAYVKGGSQSLIFEWNAGVGGSYASYQTTYSLPIGAPIVLGLLWSPARLAIYAGGTLVYQTSSQSASFGSSAQYSATSLFQLGNNGQSAWNSGNASDLVMSWGAWWSRSLSAAEHARLAADPWQLLAADDPAASLARGPSIAPGLLCGLATDTP